MERREFLIFSALSLGIPLFSNADESIEPSELTLKQKIIVNLPTYSLKLYEDNELKEEYPCRIGKPRTPTLIGKGKIIEKKPQVIFRYLSGERKGRVIRYSYLDPEKRTIKMPYRDMRGLGFEINGIMNGAVIHSTTDYWTIGTARSHGCIGVKIDDMLKLYEAVHDGPLPEFETTYQTLFFDKEKGDLTIWCDIYNKGTNNAKSLVEILNENLANAEIKNHEKISEKLKEIDKQLKAGNSEIQKIIDQGKDPKDILNKLHTSFPLEKLLSE
ncbi:L,D-transpeptidase [Candidatus Pacearchaeota archaeon]|nr:L,D-transpeptidase [Candidatus Pacearchaeota archaeon]